LQEALGKIVRMSTVGSTSSVLASVGATRTSVQIAVPADPTELRSTDGSLEAAVQRVSTMLYLRAHVWTPPSAVDMGGGVFNILV
ncbi:MAG: hypothetical protein P4L57_15495, partial [Rhizomicrobium sp.]|nr:hypothetical protein [Rhizomicrobium sp.]